MCISTIYIYTHTSHMYIIYVVADYHMPTPGITYVYRGSSYSYQIEAWKHEKRDEIWVLWANSMRWIDVTHITNLSEHSHALDDHMMTTMTLAAKTPSWDVVISCGDFMRQGAATDRRAWHESILRGRRSLLCPAVESNMVNSDKTHHLVWSAE